MEMYLFEINPSYYPDFIFSFYCTQNTSTDQPNTTEILTLLLGMCAFIGDYATKEQIILPNINFTRI